jgi:hypothetical protein
MALLPPGYLNAVVSIELDEGSEYKTIATGFLAGCPLGSKNEKGEDWSRIFLVTNRHVLENKKYVWLRFNKGRGSQRYQLQLLNEKGEDIRSYHPNPAADIAIVSIKIGRAHV